MQGEFLNFEIDSRGDEVQVMLVHELVEDLTKFDNSTNFSLQYLTEHTLNAKMSKLLDEK